MQSDRTMDLTDRAVTEPKPRELTKDEAAHVGGGMPATSDYKGPDHIGHTYF